MTLITDKEESIQYLQQYLRFNTTNPPGNEIFAVHFLADILKREGIHCTIYESQSGRASLVARIKGDGSKRPLILLSHVDVVGVEPEHWKVDPFSGAIKEDHIWGRGALDMKGMGIMELMTMLRLKREGAGLQRDVVFMALADEEQHGKLGMGWLVQHHPEETEAEYAINECSFGVTGMHGLDAPFFPISVSEKIPFWMKIQVTGEAGHGSMPPFEHASHRLIKVLNKLLGMKRPPVLVPEVLAMLTALGTHMHAPVVAWILRNLHRKQVWLIVRHFLMREKDLRCLLSDSVSINILECGLKQNVVPSAATAFVDSRLMPGTDPKAYTRRVMRTLGLKDKELEIEYLESGGASPTDDPCYKTLDAAIKRVYPKAITTPSLSSGFSDARYLRLRGVKVYGICPALIHQDDIASIHGHNERIGITSFLSGINILHDAVRTIAQNSAA